MASIVKELDKVTGTTTRSHNIADAVSKLKMGGGGGSGVLLVTHDEVDSRQSMDHSFNEIYSAIQNGIIPILYSNATDLYFYLHKAIQNGVITFSCADGWDEDGDNAAYIRFLSIDNTNAVSELVLELNIVNAAHY